ncbi:30S ribosomal protein S6--L-glutamate ligase [Luteibacter sp. UNCMF366Tsu5.1]|uniref:30S ribosomal protein S6--L-glutamate ligase n=1 Tax=Luteibacter sp. UNCMF366Tsu5.1 TaxID=1502758 RepID=UPI00090907CF|nr:30S ribosomal protein S6--L-glutamate ligase [Luteibacter sp. UNCMF366Tsu5.1]SFW44328.1 ribosomal protein S6--L-glutamate ligase [Luteibacter sp. UNCMF366Tsu5.1]
MKIAILSRNARLYSTQRLVEAARKRKHTVRVIDPLRCYMSVAPQSFAIHFKGKPLGPMDCVIPRIGASSTFYGTAVLRQLELMGVFTPNPSDAVLRARDKLRCLQLLAARGVDMPLTAIGDNPDDTADLMAMLGDPPHIIKLNEGTQGAGVVLAEKRSASQSVIEAFRGLYANFLVQEFIREANGQDLRCFVVGDQVVASMQRSSAPGEFRANLHRGGSAASVALSDDERRVAVEAASALGLEVAGVDLLRSSRGPLLLEVNASPGLEGIEGSTGVDVADAIIAHCEARLAERPVVPKVRRARARKGLTAI